MMLLLVDHRAEKFTSCYNLYHDILYLVYISRYYRNPMQIISMLNLLEMFAVLTLSSDKISFGPIDETLGMYLNPR